MLNTTLDLHIASIKNRGGVTRPFEDVMLLMLWAKAIILTRFWQHYKP
jgi:hypothetical protein